MGGAPVMSCMPRVSPAPLFTAAPTNKNKKNKMVTREVSLYLKYPGSKDALQRVQHSVLECVIEFKTGKEEVLLTTAPKELKSEYRIKGSVCLVDDELIVQFVPKNIGLYTARIFGDTRELCRPVAFLVDHNCDIEGTSYYHPVKPTSSYVRRSPAFNSSTQQHHYSAFEGVKMRGDPRGKQRPGSGQPRPPVSPLPGQQHQVHPEVFNEGHALVRGFTSDPSLSSPEALTTLSQADYQDFSPGLTADPYRSGNMGGKRMSYASGAESRPTSMIMSADQTAQFAGDLFTTVPNKKSFDHLHAEKQTGVPSYGARRNVLAFSHSSVVTPETFKNISTATGRRKSKKR